MPERHVTLSELGTPVHHGVEAGVAVDCGWPDEAAARFTCERCWRLCCACFGGPKDELCDECRPLDGRDGPA